MCLCVTRVSVVYVACNVLCALHVMCSVLHISRFCVCMFDCLRVVCSAVFVERCVLCVAR